MDLLSNLVRGLAWWAHIAIPISVCVVPPVALWLGSVIIGLAIERSQSRERFVLAARATLSLLVLVWLASLLGGWGYIAGRIAANGARELLTSGAAACVLAPVLWGCLTCSAVLRLWRVEDNWNR
jgi:hypothetical protein